MRTQDPVHQVHSDPAINRREDTAIRRALPSIAGFAAMLTASAVVAACLAPPDAVQGQWQRLMYVHVPTAWVAYLAFGGVLAASLVQLRRLAARRDPGRAGRWAHACAEVGVTCTAVTLVAGSVWGHAVWGVWWAWDARLVSTALMLSVYVGYLGVLALGDDGPAVRRAAWTGVAGFVVVPVVHFSVTWWTTLHQQATVLGPPTQAPPLDPRMAVALSLSMLAATVLGLLAVVLRVRHLAVAAPGPHGA